MKIKNFKLKIEQKGFTLIELLVVITILGILAGLTLATFGGTQARSRDSVRKTDLDALKKTLELMRQDSQGAYYYPACGSPGYLSGCNLTNSSSDPDISPDYLKEVPLDPKFTSGYYYIPSPANCTYTPQTCNSYSLVACLENTKDNQRDDTSNAVCSVSTGASYTVSPE